MAALLDPIIHPALRLEICARLDGLDELDFAALRRGLDVSESVLSKQLKLLERAGYVALRKAASGGRRRTWLSLTAAGRTAYAAHAAALRALIG